MSRSTEQTDVESGGRAADDGSADPADSESATEERTTDDPGNHRSDAILEVRGLEKHFGGITAVDGATFDVERGSLTGLIGPNGAGKSTTFNLVTGVHRPDAGTVRFDGTDVTDRPPHRVALDGLVRTFQIARELEEMTVLENVMLAPKGQAGETLWRSVLPVARRTVVEQETELRGRAWETLEFFEIDHLAEEYAGNLSGGQRKLLELARVLMTDPEMVLLDEPLAGVNPTLEEKLLERIHDLQSEGYSFLLVEHDMDVIMDHCERVIVMHQGRVLAEGAPREVRTDEDVIDAYLGGDV